MNWFRFLDLACASAILFLVCSTQEADAQVPPVSSPEIVNCLDGQHRVIRCGESYTATHAGVEYDCRCNCSNPGPDDCKQRMKSGPAEPPRQSEAIRNAAPAPAAKHERETFRGEHDNLLKGLKGGSASGASALKGAPTSLQLRGHGASSSMNLKRGGGAERTIENNSPQRRKELLEDLSTTVRVRIAKPNLQAREIYRSLKTKAPPNPVKNIDNLAPGDVVLVGAISLKDYKKTGIWEAGKSNAINFLDRWGSNNWSSPASHAAIFLGERNGKRWYLDNTSDHGPVIKEEAQFLAEYGQRQMDVATLVGQPISQHQGEEIWKAAHEMRKMVKYGIWANDKMVCSETSRWVLVRAGRRVPIKKSENRKLLGVDVGLNKKYFVDYSPADFYANEQFFVIHGLGLQRKTEPASNK